MSQEEKKLALDHLATHRIMLTGEEARQYAGFRCIECDSPQVVYFISKPMSGVFDAGAYCYTHLLARCRITRMIPFPIEQELLNKLKSDMGLPINAPPKGKITL